MAIVILGGTFGPPHLNHKQSFDWLHNQGHVVWVVPAIAHEFKPHVLPSYLHRREMAKLTFGEGVVHPLEEEVLKTIPLPIRAIDVLRLARGEVFGGIPTEKQVKLFFAIGPDVKIETWDGVEDIYNEGFDFIRVPEMGSFRSTDIRDLIKGGNPKWESFVTPEVAQFIKVHGLYV